MANWDPLAIVIEPLVGLLSQTRNDPSAQGQNHGNDHFNQDPSGHRHCPDW